MVDAAQPQTTSRPVRPLSIGIDGRFLQDRVDGIARYTYGLLNGLCSLEGNHRITLFIDPARSSGQFPLDSLIRTGKLQLRRFGAPLYSPRELWAWPIRLYGVPVHVFHAPYFWSPLALPCPLVTTVHDMIFDRYPQYIPGRRYLLLYKLFSRLALKRSARVIAVSEATKRDIVQFANTNRAKVATIWSGIDPAFGRAVTEEERGRVRRKYALPPDYVLALAARRPHKNIGRLVAAFSRIAPEIPHSLVLAGAIDRRFVDRSAEAITGLIRQGRVREIEHVEEQDLRALYAGAALFVQPSIIEGFGFPVLEAMACGCPVACSGTSSLPEIAGDAAVSFDPRSVEAITDAIRRVLASPGLRDVLRRRGLRRVGEFSQRTAAAKTLQVYRCAAYGTDCEEIMGL